MAAKLKSKSTTSVRMKMRRTEVGASRGEIIDPNKAVRRKIAHAATLRTFELLGKNYQAPKGVVNELQRKLKKYEQCQESGSVDSFLKSVKGDLPDWAMYFRGIRHREDLTQKEMAKRLHLTQSNISDIERGQRPIGKKLARQIAEKFSAEYRLLL